MQKFTNKLAAVALACLTLASVACDKDDDDKKSSNLTVQEMVGDYTGTFNFTPSPSNINPNPQPESNIEVAFEVTEQGMIHFAEFPAASLVKALLGEQGSALIPMLGTITYDATIGTPTADDSNLSASLTTPQLQITIPNVIVALITIESPEQLTYTKTGEIKFTLKTTKCKLGDDEPFDLVNVLEFTAKKQ